MQSSGPLRCTMGTDDCGMQAGISKLHQRSTDEISRAPIDICHIWFET